MKYLILSLALITACSTATDEGKEYPFQLSSWLIATPDSANWIGNPVMAKQNGDTITINNPNNASLTATRIPEEDGVQWIHGTDEFLTVPSMKAFEITYADSAPPQDVHGIISEVVWDTSNLGYIDPFGSGLGGTGDVLVAISRLRYNCEPDSISVVEHSISYFHSDSTHAVTYDFQIEDIVDVFHELGCSEY